MKLGIMQPYLFPYIGYFQLINEVHKFVVFDDVNYIKKGWINRNRILLNGKEYVFTVPVEKASQNKQINQINLCTDKIWKSRLLKTITSGYSKAPSYKYVFPLLEMIISNEERNLSVFISNSIKQTCKYLGINTEIIDTAAQYCTADLKGQEKILEICKKENADIYVNPIGGQEIYNSKVFEELGLKLRFLKSGDISYEQFNSSFIPSLSIIDVMMFNDKEIITGFLNEYELL